MRRKNFKIFVVFIEKKVSDQTEVAAKNLQSCSLGLL